MFTLHVHLLDGVCARVYLSSNMRPHLTEAFESFTSHCSLTLEVTLSSQHAALCKLVPIPFPLFFQLGLHLPWNLLLLLSTP